MIRKINCAECLHPIEIYPPDDPHNRMYLEEKDARDPIKVSYKCPKCDHINDRYWGTRFLI